jgi:probable rRNA maturation factor
MDDDWPQKVTCPRANGVRVASGAAIEIADPHGLVPSMVLNQLSAWVAAAASRLGLTGEVRVRLENDADMAAAHRRFAGVDGTTDVLTFDLRDKEEAGADPARMDVDIYACVDEARRQAAARGHEPERELLLYVVHGVLHCLGEDDHDDAAYARMHAREDELLESIGVGRVFHAAMREGWGGTA